MREKGEQRHFRRLLEGQVVIDRNKAVPRCKRCPYHHPEFKYRRCLYATCPYGKSDSEVFRKHPLNADKYSGGGGMSV